MSTGSNFFHPWVVSRRTRIALGTLVVMACAVVFVTNWLLRDRFTQSTRNEAELQLLLNSGNLMAELRQNRIVAQLLARDPTLTNSLQTSDHALSTERLLSFFDETGAASLTLLDAQGEAVASTDGDLPGTLHSEQPYFSETLGAPQTGFYVQARETGSYGFFYAHRIMADADALGVILVEPDLRKFERTWAGLSEAVVVVDGDGTIILATEPLWRGKSEDGALQTEPPQTAIQRAIRATSDWGALPADAYVQGEAVMRMETRVAFKDWQVVSFTTYASVRDRVNVVLALEIMGFAILLALVFYFSSRRSASRVELFRRESADLRLLNQQLQQEVAERKRVQENLAVAEQTLEQSSKLAALGEMSAAVSHELNQPLAAMKTYLAGARLLLRRNRPEEALSAFGRIDDLIERMGAITRQLKSYARKGQDEWSPVNLNDAISASVALMEPQLRQRHVKIARILPREPVEIFGDRLRLEQVIINLLRNALDATKVVQDARIDILLAAGETATLTIRDNGPGIKDTDALFEPFYTTKQPGDGVGLGLAISSGIVNELGGRLRARNGSQGGAVFEIQLPIHNAGGEADGISAAE